MNHNSNRQLREATVVSGQVSGQVSGPISGQIKPSAAELLRLYADMRLIREVEQRLSILFGDGEIPGFIHLSIGQEAVAVGVAGALRTDDTLASNHRGHGHAIAKGLDLP